MPDLIPTSVPLLGQKGTDGPFVAEVRERVGECTALVWACDHVHPDRASARACAEEHISGGRMAP